MDVIDRNRMWKNLKQRLGLKRLGCCGAIFGSDTTTAATTPTITITDTLNMDDDCNADDNYSRRSSVSAPSIGRASSGMNLAMALEAERNHHGAGPGTVGTVKTLMTLIEETDGVDMKKARRSSSRRRRRKRRRRRRERSSGTAEGGGGGGGGSCGEVCCVCMERNKGAAFIPCGHTFCRACSRELWITRGSCPICNRSILEILDIF